MESQPKDTADMTNELKYMTVDEAEGTIEASESQFERLDELTQRLASGEFHKPITGKIPRVCVDGRPGGEEGPCVPGGTFGLTVADDLTTQRFTKGESLADADRDISQVILGEGEPVGGHCDEHAHGENCGCGFKDKIRRMYSYIWRNAQAIRDQATALGVEVSDEVHNLIITRAQERTDFPTGAELSTALTEVAGPDAESLLRGSHKEVAAAVNKRSGQGLDRKAIAAAFGPEYQAFNADVWAYQAGADAISLSEEEAAQKVVALVYITCATVGVLCGPGMRVTPVPAAS